MRLNKVGVNAFAARSAPTKLRSKRHGVDIIIAKYTGIDGNNTHQRKYSVMRRLSLHLHVQLLLLESVLQ